MLLNYLMVAGVFLIGIETVNISHIIDFAFGLNIVSSVADIYRNAEVL